MKKLSPKPGTNKVDRKSLALKLAAESKLVQKESMKVLAEFENIYDKHTRKNEGKETMKGCSAC